MLNTNDDVNVIEYVDAFRRHWLTIALFVGVGTLLGGLMAAAAPRLYVAQVSLASKASASAAPDAVAVSNMISLIANPSSASRIVREFNLDQQPHPVTAQDLFSHDVTVERDGAVIIITARMRDPILTSKVVERVAELGIETVQQFGATERNRRLDNLRAQMEAARAQLAQVSAETDSADLAAARERLAAAEQQLASSSHEPSLGWGNPKFRDAYVEKMAQMIAESRANIATLERRVAAAHASKSPTSGDNEAPVVEAEGNRSVALTLYNELAANYARAMILSKTDPPVLQLLGPPETPATPVARHFTRTAAVGAAVGLICGSLVVLVMPAFRRRTPTASAPPDRP